MTLLSEAFYSRESLVVARDLLGKLLVRDDVTLRITEVEAYRHLPPPGDTANHGRAGRTARNAPMWGPGGRAYVYIIYGMHPMLNLVTGPADQAEAVLIRAAEPIAGIATILERRKWTRAADKPELLVGPGKVARALALDRDFNHHALFEPGGLEVHDAPPVAAALVGPRIGIDYADPEHRDAPWRLADAGSAWVFKKTLMRPERAEAPRARRPRGTRAR